MNRGWGFSSSPLEHLSVFFGLLARMRAMPWQVGIPHHPPVHTVLAKKCTGSHNAKNPQKCAIGRHFTKQATTRRRRIVAAPTTDCGSAADGLWQRRRWIVVTPPLD